MSISWSNTLTPLFLYQLRATAAAFQVASRGLSWIILPHLKGRTRYGRPRRMDQVCQAD